MFGDNIFERKMYGTFWGIWSWSIPSRNPNDCHIWSRRNTQNCPTSQHFLGGIYLFVPISGVYKCTVVIFGVAKNGSKSRGFDHLVLCTTRAVLCIIETGLPGGPTIQPWWLAVGRVESAKFLVEKNRRLSWKLKGWIWKKIRSVECESWRCNWISYISC